MAFILLQPGRGKSSLVTVIEGISVMTFVLVVGTTVTGGARPRVRVTSIVVGAGDDSAATRGTVKTEKRNE